MQSQARKGLRSQVKHKLTHPYTSLILTHPYTSLHSLGTPWPPVQRRPRTTVEPKGAIFLKKCQNSWSTDTVCTNSYRKWFEVSKTFKAFQGTWRLGVSEPAEILTWNLSLERLHDNRLGLSGLMDNLPLNLNAELRNLPQLSTPVCKMSSV